MQLLLKMAYAEQNVNVRHKYNRDIREDLHTVYTFLKSIPLTTPNSESNFILACCLDFHDPTLLSLGTSSFSFDWLRSVAIR